LATARWAGMPTALSCGTPILDEEAFLRLLGKV